MTIHRFAVAVALAGISPVLCVSSAHAQVETAEEADAVLFEADQVSQLFEGGPVVAEGAVRAHFGDSILRADKVIYDPATEIVSAVGNVAITQADGQTYFADEARLTDDLRNGVTTSFRAILATNARIASQTAIRSNNSVNELNRAVYSACPVCADGQNIRPTWRLKALRVKQDSERKVVTYRHAFLEVKGVPIFYMPYFSHPDPSVDRQTGFLAPKPGYNGDLGANVEIPYYIAPAPNYDATLAPKITEVDGVLWQGEWRHRLRRGNFTLQGSVIDADRRDIDNNVIGEAPARWHYFGVGDFQLRDNWRWGFDIAQTSDDTFLRRYDISQSGPFTKNEGLLISNRLTSNAFLSRRTQNEFLRIDGYVFQGLRASDDSNVTPIVLPSIEYRRSLPMRVFGGKVEARGDLLVLQRENGVDTRRLSTAVEWRRSAVTRSGQKLAAFVELRGDFYGNEDIEEGTEIVTPGPRDIDSVIARVLPTAGVSWSYPFIKRTRRATHIVEPVIQAIVSTSGGNPNDIFNEDSQSLEFDTASLLRANRFPGLDLWEDGQRANVLLRLRSEWNNGLRFRSEIGQVYRLQDETPFDANTGLDESTSDLVGEIELTYKRALSIRQRFRVDDEDWAVRRNETAARSQLGPLQIGATYLRLDQSNQTFGLTRREELNVAGALKLAPRWTLTGGWREDLANQRTLSTQYGLSYRDACSALGIVYRRDFTRDRDVGPNTSFLVTFELTSLFEGGLGTQDVLRDFSN